MIWFTSDLHFNHTNIIKYCDRPFNTSEEMDNTLIANINEHVKENDMLYILGDFAFIRGGNAEYGLELFNRIQCKNKILIKGNHDDKRVKQLPWTEYHLMKDLKIDGYKPIIMCHHPIENLARDHMGIYQQHIHLHGHIHSKNPISPDRCSVFDVGIDAWNYRPVSIEEIQILANL